MKTHFFFLAGSLVFFSAGVLAADNNDPCEQIQTACGEAGFTRDLPGGKDLMTKCFNPILQGQDVSGVKVDADTVKKCNAQQNAKPSGKKHKRGQSSLGS